MVWFSNRRARLRKHAGSIAHSVSSLPLTTCQYTAGHELGQIPQMPQIPGGIPQMPTTHHQGSTTLHQVPTSLHQVSGSVAQMASSMAQVPTSMSSALHSQVSLSGHLGSLSGHTSGMQLGQVPGIQPPAAHGAPTTLSHNSGNTDWCRAQLGWSQFNHFQGGEYPSSHATHQLASHASHGAQVSSSANTPSTEWYDQSYEYAQHAQLNYHRSMGGIF